MLKKPWFVVILCLLIVIGSTLYNVHKDLDPQCAQFKNIFTCPGGIAEQLNLVCTASNGIVKLAEKYGVDEFDTFNTEDICTSLRLSIGDAEASELASLYRMLIATTDDLRNSLRLKELSAADAKLFSDFDAEYLTAQRTISESAYNTSVDNYLNKDLRTFSRFFARLCGVKLPTKFA